MAWRVVSASIPKDDADVNQDAWHASGDTIAIADGASSGYDSAAWARTLVSNATHFSGIVRTRVLSLADASGAQRSSADSCREKPCAHVLREALDAVQRRYEPRTVDGAGWLQREASSRPASSTLAIAMHDALHARLLLFSLGDSCWFVIRDGGIRATFPFTKASEFPHQPRLVYSTPGRLGNYGRFIALAQSMRAIERDPTRTRRLSSIMALVDFDPARDTLVGATDALAKWILEDHSRLGISEMRSLLALTEEPDGCPRVASDRKLYQSGRDEKQRLKRECRRRNDGSSVAAFADCTLATIVERARGDGELERDDTTLIIARWRPESMR